MLGYKTLHMYVPKDIEKLCNFINSNPICKVYRKYRYDTVAGSSKEECISENSEITFKSGVLNMGDRSIQFNTWGSSDVKVFLGKDIIIQLPCGYNGNSIFYRIVKI